MSQETCERCGSTRVEAGTIESASFRPSRSTRWKKVFSVGLQLHCVACLDCGAVSRIRVDPKAVEKSLE